MTDAMRGWAEEPTSVCVGMRQTEADVLNCRHQVDHILAPLLLAQRVGCQSRVTQIRHVAWPQCVHLRSEDMRIGSQTV